ncbi:hypothetical protein [Tsukamurella spumae]|uniref:Uncharacterized protein n=1 Tax=Tsukamurella spumae TaxID=44753 RepID=A0A846WXB8_9ACTN|nr:hypothetical protein [Tsukamurella spumae]NKY17798.1 hypothetical protein [Tsukamurella spumae]
MTWNAENYAAEIAAKEASTGKKFVEALCCECGNHFMRWRSPKFSEGVAWPLCSQFEQRTITAPCKPCGRRTKHAELTRDAWRDYREIEQHVAVDGWALPELSESVRQRWDGKRESDQGLREDMHRSYWAKVEKDLAGGTIGEWSGSIVWTD